MKKINRIKKIILLGVLLFLNNCCFSQGVAINTTSANAHPSAMLDISATDKGILIPRVTEAQKLLIPAPAVGLLVYQTDGNVGFWFFDCNSWVNMSNQSNQGSTINMGVNVGNTLYWNGNEWTVDTQNLYNDGNNVGIGTNTPHSSAIIDINSSNKGILIPRLTTLQRNSILAPAEGLLIFNVDTKCFESFVLNQWNNVSCPNTCFPPSKPQSINGPNQVCENTAFSYSINEINAATYYEWTVPSGWTITSGQGSTSIDVITGNAGQNGDIAVKAANSCGLSASNSISVVSDPYVPASISISVNPSNNICFGDNVTFTATAINGGTSPVYQWKINGNNVGTNNNVFSTTLINDNDTVECELVSNALCVTGSPAISNAIIMKVNNVPSSPAAGVNIPDHTQITWNWNTVPNAIGYKYNTVNDYNTAIDNEINTTYVLTGLSGATKYNLYVWAYNNCGPSSVTVLSETTTFMCGDNITVNHIAGDVAPVSKTTTYSTTFSNASGAMKCWITKNLGADIQATSVTDDSEPAAGWYWQFNRKQGFKHDGTNRIPTITWVSSVNENSDWLPQNDPCNIILGDTWRLPTYSEYNNFNAFMGWSNYNQVYSALFFHSAGELSYDSGTLGSRGSYGRYWTSTQTSNNNANYLRIGSSYVNIGNYYKTWGFTVRCLKD